MSKATKRKHVTKEVQEDLDIPTEKESIVRVIDSRGNNLHEVMDSTGEHYLVSMPVKFRRNIWVKKGNYVLVEPIPEGDKVKAEIAKILTKEHIRYYRSQGCWPNKFDDSTQQNEEANQIGNDLEGKDIFVNTNRRKPRARGLHVSDSETSDSD